jgi:hypothetical protein
MSFGFVYGRPQGHVNRRGCLSLQSSRLMALSSAKNRRMSPTKDSRYGRWQFYGIAGHGGKIVIPATQKTQSCIAGATVWANRRPSPDNTGEATAESRKAPDNS